VVGSTYLILLEIYLGVTVPKIIEICWHSTKLLQQEVKVIWQKAPHGGLIPRLGVTPGVESCTIIPGVGFPISVP